VAGSGDPNRRDRYGHRVSDGEPGRARPAQIGAEAMRRLCARSVCVVEAGLTAAEIAQVEQLFGFEFADDHPAGRPVCAHSPHT
jgi:hypothetical protein